jgi:lipoate-protein ligase A
MLDMANYKKMIYDMTDNLLLETCVICNNRSGKPCVITNGSTKHNEEFAEENGVWPLFVGHIGGSIVLFPKDIGFTWVTKESKLQDIMKDILEYLQKYNSEITMNGNDVMLGDNKLFGTMSNGKGPCYEGMFFSFDIDLDIIKGVCTKPMVKEPLGLSSLGITPEEMAKLAEDLAKKYNLKLYGGDE